jgi:hypothetical protein
VTIRGRLIALAGLVLAGCGAASNAPVIPPTLPTAAVPYLSSVHKPLTASFLAREAQAPSLAQRLDGWGFEGAADRYFQGESRRLQVVDSRTLRFRDALGAAAFVTYMRSHLDPYLGSYPRVKPFGSGIVATAQECQCHLANPAYLAVVARGPEVTWLEINGPGATRRQLTSLVERAP